jgi:hypothetical protein
MPTSSEKRALIFLAAIAALGVSVRAVRAPGGGGDPANPALDRQIAAVDSATARKRAAPSSRGRARAGARKSPADSVELSAAREDPPARSRRPSATDADPLALYEKRRRDVAESNRGAQDRLDALSEAIRVTPIAPRHPAPPRPSTPTTELVDLDTADEVTIATLPWIGPVLAARIVDDRTKRGAFGSLDGLQRVAGIGPGVTRRIASRVKFSGSGMGPTKYLPFRKLRS